MSRRRYRGLMSTIQYNICGDGYDADERARLIFEKAQRRIDSAYEKGRADERMQMLIPYDVESIEELIENVRAKAIKEFAMWFSESLKVDECIREYTENRWIEDFNDWLKEHREV